MICSPNGTYTQVPYRQQVAFGQGGRLAPLNLPKPPATADPASFGVDPKGRTPHSQQSERSLIFPPCIHSDVLCSPDNALHTAHYWVGPGPLTWASIKTNREVFSQGYPGGTALAASSTANSLRSIHYVIPVIPCVEARHVRPPYLPNLT